jgi:hypothetical protein
VGYRRLWVYLGMAGKLQVVGRIIKRILVHCKDGQRWKQDVQGLIELLQGRRHTVCGHCADSSPGCRIMNSCLEMRGTGYLRRGYIVRRCTSIMYGREDGRTATEYVLALTSLVPLALLT